MFSSPQPIPLPCPDREVLVAFALGRLSEAEIASLAEHLDTCPGCASLLDALHASPEADSVLEQVRRCLLSPSPREVEAWDAIEAQLTLPDRPGAVSPADFTVDQALGTTLAGYRLVERLGKGGMGVVYRAVQLALGRPVAVKTLHRHALDAPALCARFRTEGTALARLDHPGVVRVLDLAEHHGTPLLVMELVEGQTLGQRLRGGPLAFRQAAALVRGLAAAVAYAHARGVLHRDLKPSNVLLDAHGTPRVADFGLARLLDRDDGLTAPDMVLGTPAYMAPEQASARPVGPPADVWALGAVLYECLTGRPPFQGETRLATLELVRTARLLPPSRLRPGLPPGLDAICLKCLDKDPAGRYPGADALADDLDRWLAGQRPSALARRPYLSRAAAVVALVLTAAAGAVGLSGSTNPQPGVEEPETPLREGTPQVLLQATDSSPLPVPLIGQENTTTARTADGHISVDARGLCLLDLVPRLARAGYRFSAEVRHLQSARGGWAGLYFARRAYARVPAEVQGFAHLSFNDVDSTQIGPLILPPPTQPRKENRARLVLHLASDPQIAPYIDHSLPIAGGDWYLPAGAHRGPWRRLEVEVTPAKVTARWDGHSFAVDPAAIDQWLVRQLAELRDRRALDLPLADAQSAYTPGGGLGLYVYRSTAWFRNVRLTPLLEDRH